MYYKKIFSGLNKCKVKYLIAGGVAVNLYGIPRMTYDIDIIIDLHQDNIKKAINCLKKMDFIPNIPVKFTDLLDEDQRKIWKEDKHLIAFPLINSKINYEEIDILLLDDFDFDREYKNKTLFTLDNIDIPVISINGLIIIKQAASRTQDIKDIELLKKLKEFKDEKED